MTLALHQGALNNQNGIIAAQHALTLDSGALSNDRGLLQSGEICGWTLTASA